MTQQKEQQKKLLSEIMEADQKNGLYDNHIVETNKMVTAVEWLMQNIEKTLPNFIEAWGVEFEQAKQMEKEQIIYAHLTGLIHPLETEATKQAEQYYNETFGK